MKKSNYPMYPLYIPTKGRYEYLTTSMYLNKMKCYHYIIVEPSEINHYKESVDKKNLCYTKILELDLEYKKKYDLLDRYGLSKPTGAGPARNFAWDHSIRNGFEWHWIMDDNIRNFKYRVKNKRNPILTPSIFRAMEDFCLRYENIYMAGPNYHSLAIRTLRMPPFTPNTRIYSCNLIKNNIPFRWRGRYNEDTILSLDMLTKGIGTVLFNVFLQEKMQTQTQKGGNTDSVYKDGTYDKSKMLFDMYPKYTKIVMRWGRPHHYVDYSPFKSIKWVKKESYQKNEDHMYGIRKVEK